MSKLITTRMTAIAAVALIAWATYGLTRDVEPWSAVTPSRPHSTEVETAVFGFG